MTNRPKARGTAAESAVTKYLRANGFPHAERRALSGNQDKGDILVCPGLILEVKAHATAATGQPGPSLLADWMGQAEDERVNAHADLCPLVVKRKGTTDPGRWFAYLPLRDLCMVACREIPDRNRYATVQLTLGDLVRVLRVAGYGTLKEDQ